MNILHPKHFSQTLLKIRTFLWHLRKLTVISKCHLISNLTLNSLVVVTMLFPQSRILSRLTLYFQLYLFWLIFRWNSSTYFCFGLFFLCVCYWCLFSFFMTLDLIFFPWSHLTCSSIPCNSTKLDNIAGGFIQVPHLWHDVSQMKLNINASHHNVQSIRHIYAPLVLLSLLT
jgi:hypothetical protein